VKNIRKDMKALAKTLRTQLENTVKAAREVAEKAGQAALAQLALGEGKAPDYLNADQKALRRSLRAHGRALGDIKHKDETQELPHLVWEVAYEHWHRMLFARFLAENSLLMWEPGAAVSLDDCRDMVDNHPDMAMGAKSHWELAGKLAARMLPQVFKPQSPVFELSFAPEDQRALEKLLANLPAEVFQASDSLGWVYQFWQSKRKDEVNASEVKIGADELPAVTQLFTEPYMVDFLLHNSLGAWWHTRHPGQAFPVPMPYLRTVSAFDSSQAEAQEGEDSAEPSHSREGGSPVPPVPAAGKFEGWPDTLSTFKLLDPSCGSGHFLVAAFLLLVPLRMADEGLTVLDAVDLVLQDNLHGLEIDQRCVEIAVFALALTAWRYPDEGGNPLGVRPEMPAPRVACCGLKVAARAPDWAALVPDDAANAEHLRQGLNRLHDTFAQAPLLGSLLDPSKANLGDLFAADYSILWDLLQTALATEQQVTLFDEVEGRWDLALSAQGLLDAARLLEQRYHLVITNVPYLARGKQSDELKIFCDSHYQLARNDLASVFVERCHELAASGGVVCIVSPQNWWFLQSYSTFRRWLLSGTRLDLMVALGEEAWEYFGDRGPLATLMIATNISAAPDTRFRGYNAIKLPTIGEKVAGLQSGELLTLSQASQLQNPDARIVLNKETSTKSLLQEFAASNQGITTGDNPRFIHYFWEFSGWGLQWTRLQSTGDTSAHFVGREQVFLWENGSGPLAASSAARIQGQAIWGRAGIAVRQMRDLPATLNRGSPWDMNSATLVPRDPAHLTAIWCFCASPDYNEAVRQIDQALKVTNATLVKVPFDLAYWQQVADERYPLGLPKPYSDDPTQWLFHGHPQTATDPLQVAVARLLGYVWPAEMDDKMELSDEARGWIARCVLLAKHADDDGIVCLQPVRGEQPAHERLLALLIDAWETVTPGSWTPSVLDKLLVQADCAGKGLAVWLREQFFEQHAKRFQHRPFIWHVWDGQKDGFGALVNYHMLDAKNLERLIHTYLGDWIRTQEAGVASGIDGAPLRLSAAQNLKMRLQAILNGEQPYDIFVRWKPLAGQPIGWNPDLNDGVRLNIRPFMTAEVLRHNKKPKLNVTWDKDRGKDVESAPWFKVFQGERINDHHLSLADKVAARTDGANHEN
jgi:hypothetical protein